MSRLSAAAEELGRATFLARVTARGVVRTASRFLRVAETLVLGERPSVVLDVDPPDGGQGRHPSLLCRCEGWEHDSVAEHLPDCPWDAVRCRSCEGNGHCRGCGGDGVAGTVYREVGGALFEELRDVRVDPRGLLSRVTWLEDGCEYEATVPTEVLSVARDPDGLGMVADLALGDADSLRKELEQARAEIRELKRDLSNVMHERPLTITLQNCQADRDHLRELLGAANAIITPASPAYACWRETLGHTLATPAIDYVKPAPRRTARDVLVSGILGDRCHAAGRLSDGECNWAECPQLRDGEPARSGRHCPLDNEED